MNNLDVTGLSVTTNKDKYLGNISDLNNSGCPDSKMKYNVWNGVKIVLGVIVGMPLAAATILLAIPLILVALVCAFSVFLIGKLCAHHNR